MISQFGPCFCICKAMLRPKCLKILFVWIPLSWNTIFLAKKISGGFITPNFRFFIDFFYLRSKLVFLAIFCFFEIPNSLVGVPQSLLRMLIFFYISQHPKNSGRLNWRPWANFGLPHCTTHHYMSGWRGGVVRTSITIFQNFFLLGMSFF